MANINFIPAQRLRQRRRHARIRSWCAAAAAAALLSTVTALGARVAWSRPGPSDREVADAEHRIVQARESAGVTRARIDRIQLDLEANRLVTNQPDWSVLLALLGDNTGEDVTLTSVELNEVDDEPDAPEARRILLAGIAKQQTSVSEFVLRLEGCGLFSRVHLIGTQRSDMGDVGVITFSINCSLSQEETP